jgi:YjbE family integral membrane protein
MTAVPSVWNRIVNPADLIDLPALGAFASVVMIDVTLAGDNAVVVGMAAAGLPRAEQRRVIALGIGAATALRIGFALGAVQLLAIIGLTLAGGILLLWVAWKMYRELIEARRSRAETAGADQSSALPIKSFRQVLFRVVVADVSMSLDNVLAVAGTARDHYWVLVVGLMLSVALMGAASTVVARILDHHQWLAWIGLAIVAVVAFRMIYEGSFEVIRRI